MNEFVARNGLIALDSSSISGPLTVSGSVLVTGSLIVVGTGITGSLFGTSSWTNNSITASFAPAYVLNSET